MWVLEVDQRERVRRIEAAVRTEIRAEVMQASLVAVCVFFFFQAEDGIRDIGVTGVQTCALPILPRPRLRLAGSRGGGQARPRPRNPAAVSLPGGDGARLRDLFRRSGDLLRT